MSSHISQFISVCAVFSFAAGVQAASLTGSVADPSGSAVPSATVTLHQVAGSALLTATADNQGRFSFPDIAPGEYLIDASAPGLNVPHAELLRLLNSADTQDVKLELAVSAVRTDVSVTAAAQPQPVDQISKALDVVSVPESEQRGLFAVSDAVRFVPGLRVATSGGPGALTSIQSRGLPPEDTSILIDGFRFRDPTGTKGDAGEYLGDLLLIDSARLEVLRGSGSSLYGTNAVGGAVNIIPDRGHGPVHGAVDLQGGGLGLFRGVARMAGSTLGDRLGYSAGITHLNVTEGVDSVGAVRNWSGQGTLDYALTPSVRLSETVFAKTGYAQESASPSPTDTAPGFGIIPAIPITPAQMNLAGAGLPYDPGRATFVPSLGDPDARVNSAFVDSLLRLEHDVTPRLSYQLAWALVDSARNNLDGPGGPGFFQPLFNTSDRYQGRIDTVQARVNYLFGAHQVLTAGYEWEQEHYRDLASDSNPDPAQRAYFSTSARQRTNAAFAQDEIRLFGGRLAILLSGRYTAASLDQPVFVNAPSAYAGLQLPTPPAAYTGDASLAYYFRRTSTKLRAHGGNSFRLPSIYERFGESVYQGFASAYGDPRLSPERTVSFDFGVDQLLFHQHVRLSSTYFYAHLQQVIGFLNFPPDYVDPYGRSAGYYNTGGGISRGVELSGEFRPSSRTAVSASYAYTGALDRTSQYYTGTPVAPLQAPRISPNAVKLVATQQLGRHFDLALDFEGASRFLYPLYGYAYQFAGPRQLGLIAGYTFNPAERLSARLYVRVSNALNQDYYENGFRTPPRWAVAGVRLGF